MLMIVTLYLGPGEQRGEGGVAGCCSDGGG